MENNDQENQPKNQEYRVPDKSLIFAKATAFALFIVLSTVSLIYVILYLVK